MDDLGFLYRQAAQKGHVLVNYPLTTTVRTPDTDAYNEFIAENKLDYRLLGRDEAFGLAVSRYPQMQNSLLAIPACYQLMFSRPAYLPSERPGYLELIFPISGDEKDGYAACNISVQMMFDQLQEEYRKSWHQLCLFDRKPKKKKTAHQSIDNMLIDGQPRSLVLERHKADLLNQSKFTRLTGMHFPDTLSDYQLKLFRKELAYAAEDDSRRYLHGEFVSSQCEQLAVDDRIDTGFDMSCNLAVLPLANVPSFKPQARMN